jgi:hypothetical protein
MLFVALADGRAVDYAVFFAKKQYKAVILSGTSRPQYGSEVESKDPENVSSAMPM